MCESVIIIIEFLKYNDDADCIESNKARFSSSVTLQNTSFIEDDDEDDDSTM